MRYAPSRYVCADGLSHALFPLITAPGHDIVGTWERLPHQQIIAITMLLPYTRHCNGSQLSKSRFLLAFSLLPQSGPERTWMASSCCCFARAAYIPPDTQPFTW